MILCIFASTPRNKFKFTRDYETQNYAQLSPKLANARASRFPTHFLYPIYDKFICKSPSFFHRTSCIDPLMV